MRKTVSDAREYQRQRQRRLEAARARRERRQAHRAELARKQPDRNCLLFVPAQRMYVVEFSPEHLLLIEPPELATRYGAEHAPRAARAFDELTGMQAVVHPVPRGG